jgi:hypothetical protein
MHAELLDTIQILGLIRAKQVLKCWKLFKCTLTNAIGYAGFFVWVVSTKIFSVKLILSQFVLNIEVITTKIINSVRKLSLVYNTALRPNGHTFNLLQATP